MLANASPKDGRLNDSTHYVPYSQWTVSDNGREVVENQIVFFRIQLIQVFYRHLWRQEETCVCERVSITKRKHSYESTIRYVTYLPAVSLFLTILNTCPF